MGARETRPGQNPKICQDPPHARGKTPQKALRRQCPPPPSGAHRCFGRIEDETRLRFGSFHRRLPRASPPDASLQTGSRQIHSSRTSPHQTEAHQSTQAVGERSQFRCAPRLSEAHRLLPQIALRRWTTRSRQEDEREERKGCWKRRRGLNTCSIENDIKDARKLKNDFESNKNLRYSTTGLFSAGDFGVVGIQLVILDPFVEGNIF